MTEELIRDQCRKRKIQERLWAAKDPSLQEAIDMAKVVEELQRCMRELERKDKSADVMVLSTDAIGAQQEVGALSKKYVFLN
ncbi:hypothetical protein NDU88_010974 [Pleurodeles waltl]|uniref:Uncharacterized protein n=1 Tax=Pleurodeles waltl TaxID=8319 RepID=A0AAV7QZ31_PLEWA|nr:hypothetical protein NDU88_010974 [Pleurodeles waltl]